MSRNIKCVIVGDWVGKTCLIKTYLDDTFPHEYVCPTIHETYAVTLKVDNELVNLKLWDTSGSSDYDKVRPLDYPETDVFLICFATDNSDSWENVHYKWYPEVHHHCPKTPIVLVGTKLDRRDNSNIFNKKKKNIRGSTEREGVALMKMIGAKKYVECSALTQQGVNDVFEEAVKAAVHSNTGKMPKQRELFYEK